MKYVKFSKAFMLMTLALGLASWTGCNMANTINNPTGHWGINLGSAQDFVILGKTGISSVPSSAITGNIGLSPAAESFVTGFSQTLMTDYALSPQVTGKIYAADMTSPTPSKLTTAVLDMESAYDHAADLANPDYTETATGIIGGLTLTPGLYKWTSSVTIPTDLTLTGAFNEVFLFQISGDLSISAAKKVILTGGAQAKNIFWQVSGTVDMGTTSHMEGIILGKTSINMQTGSSLNGRALAQTAVDLDQATIVSP